MTVGIGVMCEYGDCIVIASDMRASYCGMAVDPHDRTGKQYVFAPFNFSAAIAGSTSSTHAIVSELCTYLKEYIKAKQKQPEVVMVLEHMRNALEYSRKKELRRLQNCEMQLQLGCTLNDWLTGKLPTGDPINGYAVREGMRVLKGVREAFRSKVGIILAGFLQTGPVFLRGLGFEPVEDAASPAIYVIGGKGAVEAFQVLITRKQNVEMSLARTVLHVFEALKAAKIDEGVGDPASYVVMRPWNVPTPHGMQRLDSEHPLLKQWSKTYRLRDTEPLDLPMAKTLIEGALFVEKVKRSQWLGPQTLMREL